MAKRIAVVVSQGQSASPVKRQLEEDIISALLFEPGIDVVIIPHIYDLKADGTGMLALQGIKGNLIVLAWLFDRATRWTLDRYDIRGKEGLSLINTAADEEDEEDDESDSEEAAAEEAAPPVKARVVDTREIPNRRIYCIDMRVHASAAVYVDECKRIARENAMQLTSLGGIGGPGISLGGNPLPVVNLERGVTPEQLARFQNPTNDTALPLAGAPGYGQPNTPFSFLSQLGNGDLVNGTAGPSQPQRIEEEVSRRWYPVIDYARCTNCMECIDFCLFGVYGVDKAETILVEQPDNCRKGCPACSRVCPENAIIFPQHKTPTIAGSDVVAEGLKIDLSLLFGAPETGESAEQAAIRERDEQLKLAGREEVGATIGLPKRHEPQSGQPKDELDRLLDELDSLDV